MRFCCMPAVRPDPKLLTMLHVFAVARATCEELTHAPEIRNTPAPLPSTRQTAELARLETLSPSADN